MLVELITPLMLATAPVTVNLPKSDYSHQAQASSQQVAQRTTYSGTRTYDYRGQPRDSDND